MSDQRLFAGCGTLLFIGGVILFSAAAFFALGGSGSELLVFVLSLAGLGALVVSSASIVVAAIYETRRNSSSKS